jgi:hypothetical protein
MKVRIHPKQEIVIELPQGLLRAYDKDHFIRLVQQYIHDVLSDDNWYVINAEDMIDNLRYYNVFKSKL